MDSPSTLQLEKENLAFKSINKDKKVDKMMFEQIEYLIQQQFQVFTPALVFEYKPTNKEFGGWDYDDLYEFFSHFGEIDTLEINGRLALILFKTFTDAYATREFLLNSSNFKDAEKDNFVVRWYSHEDESYVTDVMKNKMRKNAPSHMVESTLGGGSRGDGGFYGMYSMPGTQNETNLSNFNGQYSYYSQWTLNQPARSEFSNVMSSQNYKPFNGYNTYNSFSNYNDFDDTQSLSSEKCLVNGKYTCRFNIQIENDNEFQVARRLIGAKVKLPLTVRAVI
jgi:hypothetical protein